MMGVRIYTEHEINQAIEQGRTVEARVSDYTRGRICQNSIVEIDAARTSGRYGDLQGHVIGTRQWVRIDDIMMSATHAELDAEGESMRASHIQGMREI